MKEKFNSNSNRMTEKNMNEIVPRKNLYNALLHPGFWFVIFGVTTIALNKQKLTFSSVNIF